MPRGFEETPRGFNLGQGADMSYMDTPAVGRPLNIMMISDFFYPDAGGVEMHIWSVAQCLLKMGHKIIVVTATKEDRIGVRYMSNFLKVYYLPFRRWIMNVTVPSGMMSVMVRNILIRESIEIVHSHQCTSVLGFESFYVASLMGIRTIYTDHSLFSISDPVSFHVNKVLNLVLRPCTRIITVSHTNKENLLIRAGLPMHKVFVIPNALDSNFFVHDESKRSAPPTITVVTVSRLEYRKGIDLLLEIIPPSCEMFPHVNFVIGGGGSMEKDLVRMKNKYNLGNRVTLLGMLPYKQVPTVLQSGHLYLNPSLTEAFCTTIVEAACAGCYVVSTNVGGIPEVLPKDVCTLAPPAAQDLRNALWHTLRNFNTLPSAKVINNRVNKLYAWTDVAKRTQTVYLAAMGTPNYTTLTAVLGRCYQGFNMTSSLVSALMCLWFYLILTITELLQPADEIDLCKEELKGHELKGHGTRRYRTEALTG